MTQRSWAVLAAAFESGDDAAGGQCAGDGIHHLLGRLLLNDQQVGVGLDGGVQLRRRSRLTQCGHPKRRTLGPLLQLGVGPQRALRRCRCPRPQENEDVVQATALEDLVVGHRIESDATRHAEGVKAVWAWASATIWHRASSSSCCTLWARSTSQGRM